MEWKARLTEAFLVCDTMKVGILSETEVMMALLSLGLNLPDTIKSKCKEMSLEEFVEFGEGVVKSLPPDGDLGKIFTALCTGKEKSIRTEELENVMSATKSCDPKDVKGIVQLLDPKGVGKFDCASFVNAFAA